MDALSTMTAVKNSTDVLFLMLGAVMVFAMHAGFAFLEVGTVRKKNQVNAFVKILTDWSVSTVAYFLVGFPLAYGISFLQPAEKLLGRHPGLRPGPLLLPALFCRLHPRDHLRRHRRARQVLAAGSCGRHLCRRFVSALRVPHLGQKRLRFCRTCSRASAAPSSMTTPAQWWFIPSAAGLPSRRCCILGPRMGRYIRSKSHPLPISNIPFLALGSWILAVGWFGFNVMSAGHLDKISGLVAVNSLLAMVGGVLSPWSPARTTPASSTTAPSPGSSPSAPAATSCTPWPLFLPAASPP